MTLPLKSMEIHQRLGHHKTLMNGFIPWFLECNKVSLVAFYDSDQIESFIDKKLVKIPADFFAIDQILVIQIV